MVVFIWRTGVYTRVKQTGPKAITVEPAPPLTPVAVDVLEHYPAAVGQPADAYKTIMSNDHDVQNAHRMFAQLVSALQMGSWATGHPLAPSPPLTQDAVVAAAAFEHQVFEAHPGGHRMSFARPSFCITLHQARLHYSHLGSATA